MADGFLDVTTAFRVPLSDLEVRTARSSGPGGQNVNRVETKVEIVFDAAASESLGEPAKSRLLAGLAREGWAEGRVRVVSQRSRSQWQNKQDALGKLADILRRALRPVRVRTATKPTRTSRVRRVDAKKRRSLVKRSRGNPLRGAE